MSWRLWAPWKRVQRYARTPTFVVGLGFLVANFGFLWYASSRAQAWSDYAQHEARYQMALAAGQSDVQRPVGGEPWVPPEWLTFAVPATSYAGIVWLMYWWARPWYRGIKHRCWACGYDLAASEAYKADHLFIRCPECGQKSMTKDPVGPCRRA